MRRAATVALLFLVLAAGLAGGAWWLAYTAALNQLADRGRANLALASDRLVSQLQQYRELTVLMADHPTVAALLTGDASVGQVQALLLRSADKTDTLDIHIYDRTGRIVASSGRADPGAALRMRGMPAVRRALQGALGVHHEQTDGPVARAYVFAAPVFGEDAEPLGALSVEVDILVLETAWAGDPQTVFFTDAAGVVFISNRTEMLLRARNPAIPATQLARFGYSKDGLRPFVGYSTRMVAGHEVWQIDGGRFLPGRALHLTRPLPVIGMTGEVLLNVAPAARIAALQAAIVAALMLVFAVIALLLAQRRRALSDRLRIEEAAKAELERRVSQRTGELSQANRSLHREVAEREEAEAALKRAQAGLVQAGKLSALGKMSAGLSHELNQPLMAIRSFAENASLFLERGAADKAAQNLTRIADLSRRMGRIIKNLRAFARQESEPMTDVDMGAVVAAVLEMSEVRIVAEGVKVSLNSPEAPVLVRGGEVRLQQVVLNLVSNALDAMAGQDDRRLQITLEQTGATVCLGVADTGPGIAEPEKIFDPFYSTKEVGQSEGMGLGLSISYGLVQSFGGAIRGRNRPEGGAEFTIELSAPSPEEAAA